MRVSKRDSLTCCVTSEERLVGLWKMWFASDEHGGYPSDMGDRWYADGWHVDTLRAFREYETVPGRGWRRLLFLWGVTSVPFFRVFGS